MRVDKCVGGLVGEILREAVSCAEVLCTPALECQTRAQWQTSDCSHIDTRALNSKRELRATRAQLIMRPRMSPQTTNYGAHQCHHHAVDNCQPDPYEARNRST